MRHKEYRAEVEKEVEQSKAEMVELQEKLKNSNEENERLKEMNDIQNRLWKVWLKEHDEVEVEKDVTEDKKNKKERKRSKRMEKMDEKLDARVEYTDSETESGEEEKEIYEVQKVRGFKKRNEDSKEGRFQDGKNRDMKQERRRFCHFWNNRRCRYRESECRFLHEESPECRFGREYNVRCMFYHPQKENFSLLHRNGKGINSWIGLTPGCQRK